MRARAVVAMVTLGSPTTVTSFRTRPARRIPCQTRKEKTLEGKETIIIFTPFIQSSIIVSSQHIRTRPCKYTVTDTYISDHKYLLPQRFLRPFSKVTVLLLATFRRARESRLTKETPPVPWSPRLPSNRSKQDRGRPRVGGRGSGVGGL